MINVSSALEGGLDKLINNVIAMSGLAEKAVRLVMDAYERGGRVRDQVMDWSRELRSMYDNIEDLAVELLVRYQPVATDLRTIKSCLKIAYDFSRFGRYAYDIALLLEMLPKVAPEDVEREMVSGMWTKAVDMIHKATRSLKDRNLGLVKFIDEEDDVVDKAFYSYLQTTMKKGSKGRLGNSTIVNLLVARYLERIADHACYIAEEVIYMVKGKKVPFKKLRKK